MRMPDVGNHGRAKQGRDTKGKRMCLAPSRYGIGTETVCLLSKTGSDVQGNAAQASRRARHDAPAGHYHYQYFRA